MVAKGIWKLQRCAFIDHSYSQKCFGSLKQKICPFTFSQLLFLIYFVFLLLGAMNIERLSFFTNLCSFLRELEIVQELSQKKSTDMIQLRRNFITVKREMQNDIYNVIPLLKEKYLNVLLAEMEIQ